MQKWNFLQTNVSLATNVHLVSRFVDTRSRYDFKLAGILEIEPFQWKKLIEKLAVCLAVRLEIFPSLRDVGTGVKDDHAIVQRVANGVVFDNPHDPANKLHEGGKITEDAEHCSDGEIGMIEAFAKLSDLDDLARELSTAS
ncbi:hypothetical protein SAMN05421770_1201 [Granulicella rosea]|uniref:Uncharacterized protein n=1 Tax=Granulicella rosea TaxID=474952 RepID=A0A239MPN3_9BACT|nr:hypothetical protein SAMN05421770_1201 [Granulicella rosea]